METDRSSRGSLQQLRQYCKRGVEAVQRRLIRRWKPSTHLFLISDSPIWVLSEEMRALGKLASQLGIRVAQNKWLKQSEQQVVFYASQFILLKETWKQLSHRMGLAYFHGKPGTPGESVFDQCYDRFCQHHRHIARVQVSYSEMRDIILDSGIDPEKVFQIPIGLHLPYFQMQTPESRHTMRTRYGIPDSAVVIGSFQKDGNGWGKGLEPKLIKGPDVLLETLEILQARIPELFVLLSGPARGYMKRGLERLAIPYRHYFLDDYAEIGNLFQTLDAYIVASRQEGGPKAVLESMASGVPLITTRVGQAMDLVIHEQNGWMVDIENAEGLAYWAEYAITRRQSLSEVLLQGRKIAEANSYASQFPLWKDFMRGFVEFKHDNFE